MIEEGSKDSFGLFKKPYIFPLVISIIAGILAISLRFVFQTMETAQIWLGCLAISVFGAYVTLVIVDPQIRKREKENTPSRSPFVLILWGLAVGFFLIVLLGAILIGYLLIAPSSSIAASLIELFQTAEGSPPNQAALGNVISLLVNGVGIAGSLAVSLALAAIYLSQNRILDQQTTIQDQQAWIMKRQHVPFLASHPDGVQLHAGRPSLETGSTAKKLEITEGEPGTWVSAGIENHGEETAEQIQLACLIDFPDIERDPPLYPHVCELEADGMITKPPQSEGALLPPNQGITLLRGHPRFSLGPDQEADFAMFCGSLQEQLLEEENRVRFGFVLIYANAMGQLFKLPLDDAYTASPDSFADLSELDVKQLAERTGPYGIEQLMDDVDWKIPSHVFKSWGVLESQK